MNEQHGVRYDNENTTVGTRPDTLVLLELGQIGVLGTLHIWTQGQCSVNNFPSKYTLQIITVQKSMTKHLAC